MQRYLLPSLIRIPLAVAIAALPLALGACSGDPTDPPEAGYQLSVRPGISASGPATGTLHALPLFEVQDAKGAPVEGVKLTLAVSSGATLPENTAITGQDGIARVSVTLGAQPGNAMLSASISRNTRRTAEVSLSIGPRPVIAALQPASFASGDTIEVVGTNWMQGVQPLVTFGGVRARSVAATNGGVTVVVPPCVSGAAGAVAVEVALGDVVTTAAVQGELTSGGAALALRPMQGVTVPAARLEQCLALGGPDAEYVIVPQYADPGELDASSVMTPTTMGYSLTTGAGAGPVTSRAQLSLGRASPPSTQMVFERRRRADEARLASRAASGGPQPLADGPAPSLQSVAPQRRQFYVLKHLNLPETFERVTAQLRYGGDRVLVYSDDASPANGFTDSDYQQLGRLFDTKLYTLTADAFGSPSDVDANGRIIVLLTPRVNALAPYPDCQITGSVNGYFWGRDLITPALPNSNVGEVFYAMVPDPNRDAGGCPQTAEAVRQSVPATFVHELQHMISYNQHVLARGGIQEADWLNEGLSHIAEDLASRVYEDDPSQPRGTPEQIFPDSSQGFIVPNVLNALDYLQAPLVSSVTVFRDLGTLPERGAAWLFLSWLGDQKGEAVYRRLVETRSTGWQNVEAQANEPFQQMFGDFALALYADLNPDVDRAGLDTRYRFASRDFRRIFARFHELGELSSPFPIFAQTLPHDGTINASMVQGTMDFYRLLGGTGNTVLRFTTQDGGSLPAARFPQVGILRIN